MSSPGKVINQSDWATKIPWRYKNVYYIHQTPFLPEEVRHGDITAGVKCVWNVITADKYSFL